MNNIVCPKCSKAAFFLFWSYDRTPEGFGIAMVICQNCGHIGRVNRATMIVVFDEV